MHIVDCRKYLNSIQVFLLQFHFHNAECGLWIPLHPLPFYPFAIWIPDCRKLIIVYDFYLSAMRIVDCRKQIILYNFTLPQFRFRNADCRKNLDSWWFSPPHSRFCNADCRLQEYLKYFPKLPSASPLPQYRLRIAEALIFFTILTSTFCFFAMRIANYGNTRTIYNFKLLQAFQAKVYT